MNGPHYTPTTLEVLSRYQEWAGGTSSDNSRRSEFMRWLSRIKAQTWKEEIMQIRRALPLPPAATLEAVKAEAWDEGWKALETWDGSGAGAINPYRREEER